MKKPIALVLAMILAFAPTISCFAEPETLYTVVAASPLGQYYNVGGENSIYTDVTKPSNQYKYATRPLVDGKLMENAIAKYDLSSLSVYDITKVELILDNSTAGNLEVYEAANDWSISSGTVKGLPSISQSSLATSVVPAPTSGVDLTNKGYPTITANYDHAVDVTTWVKQKLATGSTTFSFFCKSSAGWLYVSKLNLLITYKNNLKPVISITPPAQMPVEEAANFTVTVTDTELASVDFKLDNIALTTYTGNNGNYTVTIPPDKMTLDNHILKVTATDAYGAVAEAIHNFHPDGVITKRVVKASTLLGNYIYKDSNNNIYNSIYDYTHKPINNYHFVTRPGTDQEMFLAKYNLSDLNVYDIQKVEVIAKRTDTNSVNSQLYEVLESWSISNGTSKGLPQIGSSAIATYQFPSGTSPSLTTKGYPSDTSDYNEAIDITSWVLPKLNNGDTNFSIIFKSTSGWVYVDKLDLFVTYKENHRPTVTLTQPSANVVGIGNSFNISANIGDSDGTVGSCEVSFDGTVLTSNFSGNSVTATVPANLVTAGNHIIKITAFDNYNVVGTFNYAVQSCDYSVVSKKFTNGSGGAASLVKGSIISGEVEVISFVQGKKFTAITVIYDGQNTMKAVATETIAPPVGVKTTLSPDVAVPQADSYAQWSVKTYIWDDFDNLTPLDDASTM